MGQDTDYRGNLNNGNPPIPDICRTVGISKLGHVCYPTSVEPDDCAAAMFNSEIRFSRQPVACAFGLW